MSEFDAVTKGLNTLGGLLDGLKTKAATRSSTSAPQTSLPRIGSGSGHSFTSGNLPSVSRSGRLLSDRTPSKPHLQIDTSLSSSSFKLGQLSPYSQGGSPITLSPEISREGSFTSFVNRRGVRHQYVLVRHLKAVLEHFADKVAESKGDLGGGCVATLTSHQVREYLVNNKCYPPEDRATQQFFTSGFPTPDVVVTYTWSSPLELVCSALEAALTRIEFNTFTVWLDIFCLQQSNREMSKELLAAQSLYASAQRHLVATAPGQGLNVLTRAWCCFELAIRMKGLGFASPPQLIASTSTATAKSLNRNLMSGMSIARHTCRLGSRKLGGLIGGRLLGGSLESPPSSPSPAMSGGRGKDAQPALPPPSADPAEQLARMLAGAGRQGGQPSFMSLMTATMPEDLLVIKAEVLRVFRAPECFDELLLGFVEADEVAWLASHLHELPPGARPPIRQEVVQWIVSAYRSQLPKVEPDLVVTAVLLDLEQKKLAHLIITRIQHMVCRGPSAFDWRHLRLSQEVRRAAAAEVRRGGNAPRISESSGMDPISVKLKHRRSCRQVWQQFVQRSLQGYV